MNRKALRVAAAMGASEVVGVCSAGNAQLAQSQGATRCVDYNDQSAMDALVAEVGFDGRAGVGRRGNC